MGPPHRASSCICPEPNHSPSEPPLSPSALTHPSGTGMSSASRYQHNLKVLRRRDPSITSIFDQFSHVCVYHHNGSKWEKLGYEGSMFLYERESYPPYGFYILNRMGTDDHIQRLYPEDNIGAHGSYLIIRSYPEFTDRRLATVRAAHNGTTLDKFHEAYAISNLESLTASQKGEAKTIGLWMFATDSREPLIDTFTRLHSCIKRNQSYPQEFRYGPDRPPPSSSIANRSQANGFLSSPNTPSTATFPGHIQGQSTANGGLSELDKLFLRMQPTPLLSAATAAQQISSSNPVHSLFASLGGGGDHSHSAMVPSVPSSGSTNTGLSLLDSLFASASVSTSSTSSTASTSTFTASRFTSTSTSTLPIHNPVPTTTSTPQVLDQSTLTSLLGLPPSRTPSAASTAYSTDARSSHSSSREGDNEDEDTSDYYGSGQGSTSDGYSTSTTVLDPDADEEVQAAGASAGRPIVAQPINGHGHAHQNGRHGHGRRMNGDVTPRPPMNGFITPPVVRPHRPASALGPASVIGRRPHHRQQQGEHAPASTKVPLGTERPLVPFEPDSELWPYPHARATTTNNDNNNITTGTSNINANTTTTNNYPNEASDEEIIELDFADTSALSDPDAFRSRYRSTANGARPGGGGAEREREREKKVRTKRKQGRKTAAEHAREREEIERSWDVPSHVPTLSAGGRVYEYNFEHPESPSPCPSPEPQHQYQHQHQHQSVNGAGRNGVASTSAAKVYPPLVKGQMVVPEAVKDSVVDVAVMAGKMKTPVLERNDFVREVLTLIHTDKAFVDSLYREYTSRVG